LKLKLFLELKVEFEMKWWRENWIRIKIEIIFWSEIRITNEIMVKNWITVKMEIIFWTEITPRCRVCQMSHGPSKKLVWSAAAQLVLPVFGTYFWYF